MVKIYGLIEMMNFSRWGVMPVEVKEEHPDLWDIVSKIKNSKVGIELWDDVISKPIKKGKVTFLIPKIHLDLYERLKDKNNIICFLDDRKVFEEYAKLLNKGIKKKNPSLIEETKEQIKANYLYYIKRDKIIKEKIEKQNPEVAFIGSAHAEHIYFQNTEHDIFVEVPNNKEEIMKEMDLALTCASTEEALDVFLKNLPPLTYSLFDIKDLPEKFVGGLEAQRNNSVKIERLHNIINESMVVKRKKEPDFIGTWTMDERPPLLGFFEMYINNKYGDRFTGEIKDSLGDSNFHGTFKEDGINFTKEYAKKRDGIAIGGRIIYRGNRANRFYIGKYFSLEKPHGKGDFLMIKHTPGLEKKIIESENSKQLITNLTVKP